MPSSPVQIRDATWERLKAIPEFVKVYKVLTYPTTDAELPVLCIAILTDRASSDGQGNQSTPHFTHTFSLAVSIIAAAESAWVLDASITDLAEEMRERLLTDAEWVNASEGIESFVTDTRYPQEGATPLCEVRTTFNLTTRSVWEPVEPNRFMEIDIRRKISETEMAGAPPNEWGPRNVLEDDILLNNYLVERQVFSDSSVVLVCDAEVQSGS